MRVIVTAAGGPGGRFVTECLQAGGCHVIGVDANPLNLRHSGADETHVIPRADGQHYHHDLHRIAEPPGHFPGPTLGRGADVVMVQSDPEVAALCTEQHIRQWSMDTRLFLPSPEAVATAQDKWAASQVWALGDVPQPRTCGIYPGCEIADLLAYCGQPLWLRRRRGVGGQGSLCSAEEDLLKAWLGPNIPPDLWIACQYIPGHNCVCDMVYFRGILAGWCGRKVLSWQMAAVAQTGVSGASAVSVMWNDLELRQIADQAVRALMPEPHGVFGVDTMLDGEGRYYVTEVNAGRFNAPGPGLYLRAGRNLPLLAAICAVEQRIPVPERWRPETLPAAYAMGRTLDASPLYLTKREWDDLEDDRWA